MTKAKTKAHSTTAPKTARTEPEGTPNVRSVSQTELTVIGPVATTATAQPRQTKAALLRAMLEAPGGANLTRIMTETGWQAHTVRAALTGLRKAGLHLTRCREGDDTIYAIDAAAEVTPDEAGNFEDESAQSEALLQAAGDDRSSSALTEQGTEANEVSA